MQSFRFSRLRVCVRIASVDIKIRLVLLQQITFGLFEADKPVPLRQTFFVVSQQATLGSDGNNQFFVRFGKNRKGEIMTKGKSILTRIFIDGMSGMALGLFATLLVGTILAQISSLVGGTVGYYIGVVATTAKQMTGFGIGVSVASKFKMPPLVTVSAGVAGMLGAFAKQILAGTMVSGGVLSLSGPGEPLGAFLAAYCAVEIGGLIAGKTKVDILLTPLCCLTTGAVAGILLGSPIATFMTRVGQLINWGAEQQPFFAGIIVSVLMGMALTLPISSAAIGVSLGLSGIAAGAAVVGCCCNMVGFAFAGYKENGFSGVIAQGLGTSMLQMPNLIRKPIIWLPVIATSAILGPVSTCVFQMTCNATGSGMGTCGLVGPLMTFQTMVSQGVHPALVVTEILAIQFVAPALLAYGFSQRMRRHGWIKSGDFKLNV